MELKIGQTLISKGLGEGKIVEIIERENDLNLVVIDFGKVIKTICGKKYSTATYREDYINSNYFEM